MTTQADLDVGYAPLDVLKPVAEDLWIVDGAPLHPMGLSLPVRMTVVRLASGEMWLHSPTRFNEALRRAIEEIGPIRHLVAPNIAHWSFVQEWRRRGVEAKVWAAPKLRDRRPVRKAELRIDHDLGDRAPEAWAEDLEQVVVPGGAGFRETAFLHRRTRTLVLTDLVANLEASKLPLATRLFARATGMLAPNGRAPAYLRLVVRLRRKEAATAVARLVDQAPERVIFAHGRWFERDGAARLKRSLAWLLD